MPALLALVAALLVYSSAGLVLHWVLGPPVRPGALQREIERTTVGAPEKAPWRERINAFFFPPEAYDRTAFLRSLLLVATGGFAVGFLIFGSLIVGGLLLLVIFPYRRLLIQALRRKRKDLLNLQFKDALYAIAASLRAGASLPTAVERSYDDLQRLLRGQPHQPMVEELRYILREMQFGGSVEDALVRFRDRVDLEDVTNFVNATLLCKTRGGNLAVVIATIAQIIGDKVTVKRQVQVLTAGKRMEANLLTSVPPILVGTLAMTSPDYMAPLFTTLLGQLLALLGVVLLVAAYVIGRKVVEIEV